MMKFINEMLSAKSGQISSKRVCGCFGWVVCLAIGCIATIKSLSIPSFLDTVLLASAGLLGLYSITNIWKNNN